MDYCLPGYTAGLNAYESIPHIVSPYGKNIVIIGGETALNKAMPIMSNCLDSFNVLDTIIYGKEATMSNVNKLLELDEVLAADVLFAVGGGKAIDIVKCVASKLNKPIFAFPTIASNCASVTKEIVLYFDDGSFDQIYFMNKSVNHIFINERIILEAPYMYFHAGIGNAITKAYEPIFKSRKVVVDFEDNLALSMCTHLRDDIFMYAPKALKFFSDNDETHNLILDIIITTGYISYFMKPALSTGIAHAVYYSMTKMFGFEKLNLYGDALTYGLLVNLIFEKSSEMYRVYDFLRDNAFPVKLINLKLKQDNINEIVENVMLMPQLIDYPKILSSHDIQRTMILCEEDFLLYTI